MPGARMRNTVVEEVDRSSGSTTTPTVTKAMRYACCPRLACWLSGWIRGPAGVEAAEERVDGDQQHRQGQHPVAAARWPSGKAMSRAPTISGHQVIAEPADDRDEGATVIIIAPCVLIDRVVDVLARRRGPAAASSKRMSIAAVPGREEQRERGHEVLDADDLVVGGEPVVAAPSRPRVPWACVLIGRRRCVATRRPTAAQKRNAPMPKEEAEQGEEVAEQRGAGRGRP